MANDANEVEVVAQDVTFLGGAGGGEGGSRSSADGGDDSDQTTKPNKASKKDDIVIEDIGDEPINLDDIPF